MGIRSPAPIGRAKRLPCVKGGVMAFGHDGGIVIPGQCAPRSKYPWGAHWRGDLSPVLTARSAVIPRSEATWESVPRARRREKSPLA